MGDAARILVTLGPLLGAVAFPWWSKGGDLGLRRPTKASQCIEAKDVMQARHMLLLAEWKQAVLDSYQAAAKLSQWNRAWRQLDIKAWRERAAGSATSFSRPFYTSSAGQRLPMNMKATCFQCHEKRQEFCERCHTRIAVRADCWTCHDQLDRLPAPSPRPPAP
jgi:hypothetical protein